MRGERGDRMPEGGLSASEVGDHISEHARISHNRQEHRDWVIAVVEASLLAIVAVLAAWSGFSSAKWSTQSRLQLAAASTARTQASTHQLAALNQRNFDSSTFTAWFVAWVAGDQAKITVAENRFTPNFHTAFDAWMATNPLSNPNAPPGPTYMPQYKQPDMILSNVLDAKADRLEVAGSDDGIHSDDYVRVTVYLATVLFLLAISGHFRIRNVRIGLIVVSIVALVFSVSQLLSLPLPPT
jgi:hypothetical protein